MDKPRQSNRATIEKAFTVTACHYFPSAGSEHTKATLEAALERAKIVKVKKILFPSCTGKTGFRALDLFGRDFSIVVITHARGFRGPDYQELSERDRKLLLGRGRLL